VSESTRTTPAPPDAPGWVATGLERIDFHELRARKDGPEWIIGRMDTGRVVALPEEGARAVRLLQAGHSPNSAAARIKAELGLSVHIGHLVDDLAGLGLVAAVDGRPVPAEQPPRPTLPRLRARHTRWSLNPWLHGAVCLVILSGATTALLDARVRPSWQNVLWSGHGSFVIVSEVALTWPLIMLHELAHLITARAAGVRGRIKLGTRLQFLVVQTQVAGVWLCERRVRLTVYLSGIAVTLAIVAGSVLIQEAAGPNRLLQLVALNEAVSVALEFMVFMRTDIYFVLQDLLSCRNLYGDASAYCRFLVRSLTGRSGTDPTARLEPRERRRVRWYAMCMVLGSMGTLLLTWLIYSKVMWVLAVHAARGLSAGSGSAVADSIITLALLLAVHSLWAFAWWHGHGAQVRALLHRGRTPAAAAAR